MICESGLGAKHLMPEQGSVYVYTMVGARIVGELVACRRCARQLARDPLVVKSHWSRDSEGPTVILLCRPAKGGAARG